MDAILIFINIDVEVGKDHESQKQIIVPVHGMCKEPRMRKVEKVCGPPWSTSVTAVIHGGWMSLYIRDC